MKCIIAFVLLLSSLPICTAQSVTKAEALEDLRELEVLLNTQSSYFQLSDYNFKRLIKTIETEIVSSDSISVYELAYKFEKIIAKTIDRHASVKIEDFDEDQFEWLNLHLPFTVAPLNGKVVALKYRKSAKGY
ncbi:MAG: hypothetical protein AAF705_11970, partial [Bacteroidota bacterium]